MTAPSAPGCWSGSGVFQSIGVALEVEDDGLPEEIAVAISMATETFVQNSKIPGLLCVVHRYFDKSGNITQETSWSRIHGSMIAGLAQFESEFLPFVISRHNCMAVRVHTRILSTDRFCADFEGKAVSERWAWWRGSTPEEVRDLIIAAEVMES